MLNSVFSWRNFSFASPVRLAPLLTKPSYVFCSSWASSPFSCNWSFCSYTAFYTSKNVFHSDLMLLLCSDRYGISFFHAIPCISSLVSVTHQNCLKTVVTRSSNAPDFSKATMVFWKVGVSGLLTIASISSFCSFIPSNKAGS